MKKITLIIFAIFVFGFVFSGFASACTEGCTPGYWKQSQHEDSWAATGYSPYESFDTVFGVDVFDPDVTLLEALNLNGGGLNAFARHAVAALLNASSPDVNYKDAAWVFDKVQAAVESGNYEYYKDKFEKNNELGCPLD